jgi:tRNA(Ile)-lysidine synthase
MCGIPLSRPCKHGLLARPLLGVTRQELLAYCESAGLSYVTDSTNTDTSYTRNRIRSEVIPALLAIRREAVENSVRTAENLRTDERYLTNRTELLLNSLPEGEGIPLSRLQDPSDAIARRALMARFKEASPNTDPEQCHVEALLSLCQKGIPHTRVSLPDGTEGVIENGALSFRKKEELPEIPPYFQVLREGVQEISQTNAEIVISYSQKPINVYKNSILLSLDSATIKGVLTARRRQEGDRIRMGGMSRSIKKMFCDKKIPRELRSRLPVLCDEEGVVAVPLLGVRDGTAVSPETRDPLRVWVSLK